MAASWTSGAIYADAKGRLTAEAARLVGALIRAASPFTVGGTALAITVGASPFAYTMPERGAVFIAGTVTGLSIFRVGFEVPVQATAGCVVGCATDIVRVTYTSAPTMTFVPSQ